MTQDLPQLRPTSAQKNKHSSIASSLSKNFATCTTMRCRSCGDALYYFSTKVLTSKSESKSAVRLIEPSDCGLHGGQGEKGGACVDDKPSWRCLPGVCLLCCLVLCIVFVSVRLFFSWVVSSSLRSLMDSSSAAAVLPTELI